MKMTAVVLAAGKGTRMRSDQAKVAHRVGGQSIIEHVLDAVAWAGIEQAVVVVGHQKEEVQALLANRPGLAFAEQKEQLGTAHALLMAREYLPAGGQIMVLAGDTPLLRSEVLQQMCDYHLGSGAAATVLSTQFADPYGYGRIIRDARGAFERIVEHKDASEAERAVCEINSGIYCFDADRVWEALRQVGKDNAQGEYYLPDVLAVMRRSGLQVGIFLTDACEDIQGINDRVQLAAAEKILRQRKNTALMESGVTIMDPDSTFIDLPVAIGPDTVIYPFTIIEGATQIGVACEIGPYVRINDAIIGSRVKIENSRVIEACIGDECDIGPYAYLRPGADLGRKVKVGNSSEIKKSVIGDGSKVPHLSYVGDARIGRGVNIGAGTITCNYDGINKFETIIEDDVFIGSNTNLIAPVRIGARATTGAGSTISRDVPAGALGVERAPQKNLENWAERKRKA